MITHLRIQNFRSFLDAEVDLQPFSLIVGANGSGKSNLLKFFAAISGAAYKSDSHGNPSGAVEVGSPAVLHQPGWVIHQNGDQRPLGFRLTLDASDTMDR